ncbi:methyl-accepting chemotaxis protein [Brevundimonas vesicularis]|uniref:methyl-accepting chemotaxis protein n=1 Tax=Brevundimonas vesicularis TaxID=41276 RepID=UPI0038D3A010
MRGAYGSQQGLIKSAVSSFHMGAEGLIRLTRNPETQQLARDSLNSVARLSDVRAAVEDLQAKEAAVAAINAGAKAKAYTRAYWSFAIGGAVALIIGLVSILWLVNALSRPVVAMTRSMSRLASGDLDVAIPAIGRKDEIGQMAGAVMTFRENAEANRRLEQEAREARERAEQERARADAEAAAVAEQDRIAITALAEGMAALASGNLTHRITAPFAEKAQALKDDFNAAMDKLQNAMSVIAGRGSAIGASAVEVSQASDDLSRRTEQQAASLEESAAALEQITATVKRSAEGAVEVRSVVDAAHREAIDGRGVVNKAIQAMGTIEESSAQIGNIIGVIDEIAFQTNLLALNAGVEAARAGDAGRGFAVVASEVRALAQRSAEAAKEIKSLISASSRQVGDGVSLVGDTGQALERIADQIGRLTTIAREISASSQEQATGLQQVNVAVSQMDQMTQQNAAMVEETTAASHSLASDARELDRLMQQFQVGRDGSGLAYAA